MGGNKKLEELVAEVNSWPEWQATRVFAADIRSISDAYKAMEERAEKAEAALAIARPAILEEAAQKSESLVVKGLTDGRQIAAAIRALAHTTGQEGGR